VRFELLGVRPGANATARVAVEPVVEPFVAVLLIHVHDRLHARVGKSGELADRIQPAIVKVLLC
jgi:hypothetical protein